MTAIIAVRSYPCAPSGKADHPNQMPHFQSTFNLPTGLKAGTGSKISTIYALYTVYVSSSPLSR